jgi:pilus assembly protein CpaB
MGLRTILIVVLAVVFGVSAAALAINAVNQRHQEIPPENEPVVVAKDNVKRGTKITHDHIDLKYIPKGSAPPGTLGSVESALGQRVQIPLVKDDYVMGAKLGTSGSSMTTDIPTGMQISSIEVKNVAAGVAGFVQPGDIVDILLTVEHFQEKDPGGTVRLMQMVEVRGVDNRTEESSKVDGRVGEGAARSITVLVTPKQAQELADGQKRGSLTIVLRGPEDKTEHAYGIVGPKDLKFPEPVQEVKKEELPPPTPEKPIAAPPPIRVFKGTQEVTNP